MLEQRVKDLNEIIQSKQSETMNQSKVAQDKDSIIVTNISIKVFQKKYKAELDKVKKERDE